MSRLKRKKPFKSFSLKFKFELFSVEIEFELEFNR